MASTLQTIITIERQVELLRRVEIFAHLDDEALRGLARRMTIRRWTGGALIVGEGERDTALYVLYLSLIHI